MIILTQEGIFVRILKHYYSIYLVQCKDKCLNNEEQLCLMVFPVLQKHCYGTDVYGLSSVLQKRLNKLVKGFYGGSQGLVAYESLKVPVNHKKNENDTKQSL